MGRGASGDSGRGSVAVTVRRLRESDLNAYQALRLRALAVDPLAFGSTLARESAFEPDRWLDYVRRGSLSPTESTWLAERGTDPPGGMIVGVLGTDGVVHVYAMWVEPRLRGRGVGGRLLDTLLAWAREVAPSARVSLSVNPTQLSAMRLYLGRGFRPTGVVEPLGHTVGAVVHVMERAAADPDATLPR